MTRQEPAPAPDLTTAEKPKRDMRGISTCCLPGWHVYMAGPCFDTYAQAVIRRDYLDGKGVTWEATE